MNIFDRTFHPDEANQAFTTGRLLETGTYRYDPQDHHGPTLYYAAATLQKAAGHDATATLDGTLLRCTPLLFAVLALVFGCLTIKKLTGRLWLGLLFALLLGISPIFVFFATDFIQEMLLAAFTMMMLWAATNYLLYTTPSPLTPHPSPSHPSPSHPTPSRRLNRPTWALLFGIAAGLAFATKETALLTFAAAALAAFVTHLVQKHSPLNPQPSTLNPDPSSLTPHLSSFLVLASFLLTATLFYSSFGDNWQGVYNAFIAAPLSYLHRAAGDAVSQGAAAHIHPWWQYFKWLFGDGGLPAVLIVGGPFLGFGVLTIENARKNTPPHIRGFFTFITLYAIILTTLYSAIPYKTPWCALQLHIPLLLSALIGLVLFTRALPTQGLPVCLIMAISYSAMIGREMFQGDTFLLTKMWRDPDSKAIPYNYAAASPQVKDLANLIIEQLPHPLTSSPSHPSPLTSFAAIALPPEDTWPLPFYLRSVKDKVGYWTSFGELEALAGLGAKPNVVVVPAEEGHLVQPLFPHLKNTKRFEMRPHVRIRVFW